jgi:NAD(P)-dependent dehydrogenase (short-subunit alcohol dehydrogenase family)
LILVLDGTIGLVTGAADGLGALAAGLCRAGATVLVHGRNR